MRYANFKQVIKEAQKGTPVNISIAAAHDEDVMKAVKDAVDLGMITPFFIGFKVQIEEIARELEFDISSYEIHHTESEEEMTLLAASLAEQGKTEIIMKGLVNSTPFLRGVLHPDFKLRTDKLLSHLSAFEIPGVDHLTYMTDGGLNIAPNKKEREAIVSNGIEFLTDLGLAEPKVVLLSANERINEKMPVTQDSSQLVKTLSSKYPNAIIDGPLPLDLAISKKSLHHKGIESKVDGEADLLVVPTIEAGNILGKAITYYAGGTMAGIVLGARVPLILNSRSDSSLAKLASIALATTAVSNQLVES
ncbi:phosphate acyltransferase [Bacillus sp. FJAT-45350]|uniref:phosphate acyltransferase n=1 Tax=Bacillus sp. FJAT-45350 TaxID=2011014 RepID=UPI0015CB8F69|nr:phosphate acyltransferase [Bacillus sp. FJAT-45350]